MWWWRGGNDNAATADNNNTNSTTMAMVQIRYIPQSAIGRKRGMCMLISVGGSSILHSISRLARWDGIR